MVWIQYSLSDGTQTGTLSVAVDTAIITAAGKGQIEYEGDPSGMMVDITQDPPTVIPAP